MLWCSFYNCWCDDIENVIDDPVCDADCLACDESEVFTMSDGYLK